VAQIVNPDLETFQRERRNKAEKTGRHHFFRLVPESEYGDARHLGVEPLH
jgi:hypothetical protein